MKFFVITMLSIITFSKAFSQENHQIMGMPKIGEAMPDYIFTDVQYHNKPVLTKQDLQGKWVFLEFWHPGCKACIQSLPKMNAIQKKFKEQVKVVLVGYNHPELSQGIKPFYLRLRERQGHEMIVAYDTTYTHRWAIPSFPNIFVIDPNGVLQAITAGYEITSDLVGNLLSGNEVTFSYKLRVRKKFNPTSADSNIVYHSLLAQYEDEQVVTRPSIDDWLKSKEEAMLLSGVKLQNLFNLAYFGEMYWNRSVDSLFGEVYPFPLLEIVDQTAFTYDATRDQGFYNYYLRLPDHARTPGKIKEVMQNELNSLFNYHTTIEEKEVPVWSLEVKNASKVRRLRTQGGKFHWRGPEGSGLTAVGFEMRNASITNLLSIATQHVTYREPPFFDNTNLDFNIDISLDGDLSNINGIKKALADQGFELLKKDKKMKVLVIRDAPDRNQ